jgi:sugar-phosphatase
VDGVAVELRCQAVLFDLDGVLIDSLGVAERILRDWAVSRGVDPDLACELSHGRRDADLIPLLGAHFDVATETAWITGREERAVDPIAPMPGAQRLLAALTTGTRQHWAVVTSATRRVALGRIGSAGLPDPVRLVAAEDVARGKPEPLPYLRGAELLGAAPGDCVVIEDAMAGVHAARAAGMRCIGLGPEVDPAAVTTHVRSLDQIRAGVGDGFSWLAVSSGLR